LEENKTKQYPGLKYNYAQQKSNQIIKMKKTYRKQKNDSIKEVIEGNNFKSKNLLILITYDLNTSSIEYKYQYI